MEKTSFAYIMYDMGNNYYINERIDRKKLLNTHFRLKPLKLKQGLWDNIYKELYLELESGVGTYYFRFHTEKSIGWFFKDLGVENFKELNALTGKRNLEGFFAGDFLTWISVYDSSGEFLDEMKDIKDEKLKQEIARKNHFSYTLKIREELDYWRRIDWIKSIEVKDIEKKFIEAGDGVEKTSLNIQRGEFENYSLDSLLKDREMLCDCLDKSIESLGKYCELLKDKTATTPDYEKYFMYAGLIEENLNKRIEIKKRKLSEED
tara:strand:+ start:3870 stop:4658 length:789 start_codon:yes stop_codon:yes gene_type:complete